NVDLIDVTSCDEYACEALENQLLSVSLLICLGKHDFVERIPLCTLRGLGTGTCQQAFEKILPSTLDYNDHGPTHKANFIVERTKEDSLDTPMEVEEELLEPWILFTDGSSCTDDSGAGLIFTNPKGAEFTYANVDSRLVANQVNGTYIAKEADMVRYLENMHADTRSIVAKALRTGYYWPTMHKDERALIRACQDCQANVDSRLVANQVNGTYIAKEADMVRYLEK
nr:reverse transcriptase domain-containing protein [Tanacetum cinerariifolium]